MRAIRDYQGPLKEHEVTIFVRRGGPNYQEGLRVMGEVGKMGNLFCLSHPECHASSGFLQESVFQWLRALPPASGGAARFCCCSVPS